MRLAIFGGTFNPVHIGHLALAEEVACDFGYDLVVLVPSNVPPHKAVPYDPGPGARLSMLRSAVGDAPGLSVSPCELDRGGVSYTIDTLAALSAEYRIDGKPGLIIGDDLVPGFMAWRDAEGLLARADVLVASRIGNSVGAGFPHLKVLNPVLPISSSDIRQRIAEGRPWRRLVPAPVAEYIMGRGLYGFVPSRMERGDRAAAAGNAGGGIRDGSSRTR